LYRNKKKYCKLKISNDHIQKNPKLSSRGYDKRGESSMKKILTSMFTLALLVGVFVPFSTTHAADKKTCIVVYEHVNFKGKSKKFCSNVSDLKKHGWDNKISSFKLIGNGHAEFYKLAKYKGDVLIGDRSLSRLPSDFNDFISSFQIFN
jgi:hypothetical protein